jgi:predicted esterase YcpF (UPF0227 family)
MIMKKDKIKILYVHGLNSNGGSRTATELKRLLKVGAIVYSPDFSNELESFSEMKKNIDKAWEFIKSERIDLVIGSSMGGFVASKICGVTKILINPCLRPSEQLPRTKNISDAELKKYAEFEREREILLDMEDRLITYGLFSSNDELFSYKDLFDKLFLAAHSYTINDAHRISTTNIKNELLKLIESSIANTEELSKGFEKFEETMIDDDDNDMIVQKDIEIT